MSTTLGIKRDMANSGMPSQYRPFFKGLDIEKYSNFVLWGLRSDEENTFRHIMRHYYETMCALGLNVEWVDDAKASQPIIKKNTLVISAGMSGEFLPIVKGAYYCLHNYHVVSEDYHDRIDQSHNIRLQVYTDAALQADNKWNAVTYFDSKSQTLFQPWGTNIMPDMFFQPTFSRLPVVFWVGSIWNDEKNQGNLDEIADLKSVLSTRRILFRNIKNVSDRTNIRAVRISRIAPAIGGGIQVRENLLPCRMFKNISYGQLGFSNISKFSEVLGKTAIYEGTIAATADKVLGLSPKQYKAITSSQQEIIARDHTYVSKIANILRAFEEVRN